MQKQAAGTPAAAARTAARLRPCLTRDDALPWLPQDFPYNFEPGIEHHVLWCTEPLALEEMRRLIAQRFPGKRTTFFVNPAQLQSVLAVSCARALPDLPACCQRTAAGAVRVRAARGAAHGAALQGASLLLMQHS